VKLKEEQEKRTNGTGYVTKPVEYVFAFETTKSCGNNQGSPGIADLEEEFIKRMKFHFSLEKIGTDIQANVLKKRIILEDAGGIKVSETGPPHKEKSFFKRLFK
jgi:hypothetical protein